MVRLIKYKTVHKTKTPTKKKKKVITERKRGQKLEHHLFFTVLYWRPVVHVCCDHRPWLNPACVCVCKCVCVYVCKCNRTLQVCTNSAGLKQERWHFWVTTGEIRLQTVLSVPVLCASRPSLVDPVQSSRCAHTALSNTPLTPPPLLPLPSVSKELCLVWAVGLNEEMPSLQMALQRFGSDLFATACKLHLHVLTT